MDHIDPWDDTAAAADPDGDESDEVLATLDDENRRNSFREAAVDLILHYRLYDPLFEDVHWEDLCINHRDAYPNSPSALRRYRWIAPVLAEFIENFKDLVWYYRIDRSEGEVERSIINNVISLINGPNRFGQP